MFQSLRKFDFNKLGKNMLGAILTPPATVFATTGDVEKAKHAGLLGLGAAALIVIGFIQQPYKALLDAALDAGPAPRAAENKPAEGSGPEA